MPWKKLALLVALVAVVAAFFGLGLQDRLTFEAVKASQAQLQAAYGQDPWTVLGGFVALYLLVVTLNLPGATILGLVAGAVFGGLAGVIAVSFASSVGATLACLLSRTLLRGWVQRAFPKVVAGMDQGMAREGAFYLFSLRLIPVAPFFVVNLAMGLTAIPLRTFYWVSQLGMLPGTIVYVNAGRELGRLNSPADAFSPSLLLALALLGLLPLAGKRALAWYRRHKGAAPSGLPGVPGQGEVQRVPAPEASSPPSNDAAGLARNLAAACTDCGVCVKQCPFLQEQGTPGAVARAELAGLKGWQATDPFACSLCGLCAAVCPEKLQPATFFLALRRQAMAHGGVDLAPYARLLGYEQRGHSPLFAWYPPAQAGPVEAVFFPGCTLPGTRPQVTWRMFQALRRHSPGLAMVLDCCHKPSHDLGRQSYFVERFGEIRDKLLALGVREVFTACPNCHKVFSQYGEGVAVRTIYEVLAETVSPRDAPAQATMAVHDPCPMRGDPGVQQAVRRLLRSKGVAVQEMRHAGPRTLCCGEGGGVGLHRPDLARAWTARRASLAGTTPMVTYCAGCASFLGRLAPTVHLGELLFPSPAGPASALAGRGRSARAPLTYLHRLRLKQRLARLARRSQVRQ